MKNPNNPIHLDNLYYISGIKEDLHNVYFSPIDRREIDIPKEVYPMFNKDFTEPVYISNCFIEKYTTINDIFLLNKEAIRIEFKFKYMSNKIFYFLVDDINQKIRLLKLGRIIE